MRKTVLGIQGEQFLINGKLTYSEYPNAPKKAQGLLMNARFIQGVFHDAADGARFNRFGRTFDANVNTDDLIKALPAWYEMGLRAFTVGFQGGGACFTINNATVCNNAFSADGLTMDEAYLSRMTKILDAADGLGMIVIVSLFYCGQIDRLDGAQAVLNAVRSACAYLKKGGWKNVILEIANEYDIPPFKNFPLIQTPQGMAALIDLARRESGLPVGSSGGGGTMDYEVARASDVIFFHGNGQARQQMVKCINKARQWGFKRPILCNEDSQDLTNMQVCVDYGVSWGYYNNMTKQEPPTDWGITDGEDRFFALRMARAVGISVPELPEDERYVLQGLGAHETTDGKVWPRLASLYPETINYVDFYLNDEWIDRCYDSPFTLYFHSNWLQFPWAGAGGAWRAVAALRDGSSVVRTAEAP